MTRFTIYRRSTMTPAGFNMGRPMMVRASTATDALINWYATSTQADPLGDFVAVEAPALTADELAESEALTALLNFEDIVSPPAYVAAPTTPKGPMMTWDIRCHGEYIGSITTRRQADGQHYSARTGNRELRQYASMMVDPAAFHEIVLVAVNAAR